MDIQPHLSPNPRYHLMLYSCSKGPGYVDPGHEDAVWNCDINYSITSRNDTGLVTRGRCAAVTGDDDPAHPLFGWLSGWNNLQMPKDSGYRVGVGAGPGYDSFLILKLHFLNTTRDWHDRDYGLDLTISRQPPTRLVGIMTSEMTAGFVAANSTTLVEHVCPVDSDVDLHPFQVQTHGHMHSRLISVWKVDGGSKDWSLIGCASGSGKGFNPVADANLILKKGDLIATRCVIDNPLDQALPFG